MPGDMNSSFCQRRIFNKSATGQWSCFLSLKIDIKSFSLSFFCAQGDEDQMVDAVAFLNPVSVAFEVTKDFMNYKSGIYTR